MREARKDALRVDFDRSVTIEFHGSTISGDGDLLAYHKLDEVFTLIVLTDLRTRSNVQHRLAALLRQPIYSRMAGYNDTNDAERLNSDEATQEAHSRFVQFGQ